MMKKKKLLGLSLIIFIVLGIMLSNGLIAYASQDDTYEIILPSGTIKLYSPLEIEDIDSYTDGGTVGVTIRDSKGNYFRFCLDGRCEIVLPKEEFETLEELNKYINEQPPKPYHIYVGADHPNRPGAQKIPIGGKEEKSIINILENASVSEKQFWDFPKDFSISYREGKKKSLIETLKERQTSPVPK
ncbi:MAG: hypothetical protein ABIA97_03380 [Candidatus Omnitrophota bacterium]